MELALIAFDALDPRVVYENLDELPHFRSLMTDSMNGSWRTPGHTIPSFTATLTGKQYNNCDFHWDEGRGSYQRHRQTELDYMWDVSDSSMTLLNIPVLYPPEDIDDAMVCGFLTPDQATEDNLARPIEVQEMLNEHDYVPDVPADRTYDEMGGEGMMNYLYSIMHNRVTVAEELIQKYDSDLFYGVWTSTDRWFHQCHKHGEDFMPLYKFADEILGDMMNILPHDVPKIVFSDHGFAHYPSDDGVHKGHMYDGFYAIDSDAVPGYRDDSVSIFDLFPTVLNYLDGDVPVQCEGRTLFHNDEQNETVKERLDDLGYLE